MFHYRENFFASVNELNEWVGNRAIRRHQLATCLGSRIAICCPVSGARLDAYELFLDHKLTIYIKFSGIAGDIVLFSKNLGNGFPLDNFLFLANNECKEFSIKSREKNSFFLKEEHEKTDAYELGCSILGNLITSESSNNQRIIAFNSPNFAHVYWNLLPALYELPLFTGSTENNYYLISPYTPLGDLSQIFSVGGLAIRHLHPKQLFTKDVRFIKIRYGANLGATYVPISLTKTLLDNFKLKLNDESKHRLAKIDANKKPVFWVSIQQLRRCLLNQREFIVAVLKFFFESFPKGLVIIDGFSMPLDNSLNRWSERVIELDREIEIIVTHLKKQVSNIDVADQIININGLPVTDAIAIAAFADFYLCHSGTQQHKIAWFYNVNGIIHSPLPENLTLTTSRWHGDQTQIAKSPKHIPAKWITPSDQNPEHVKNRNRDYSIAHPKIAAKWVIDQLKAFLNNSA